MIDPLTAEERVTLNKLQRKIQERHAMMRATLGRTIEHHFGTSSIGLHSASDIQEVLVHNADIFIDALQPFRKNKCNT
jgi:hypothetical protein